ncbi:hypothetical protein SAMN05444972_104123 [Marininema halotolerans]|uniref:Uncharacterized protein n=2 Tax=Marininema halotolerans TaxID=1155944 RepID=A0A1I6R4P1_9BACL|nr:hypothetical protein SAMN05444972_104123 [Marininema halotolerans]
MLEVSRQLYRIQCIFLFSQKLLAGFFVMTMEMIKVILYFSLGSRPCDGRTHHPLDGEPTGSKGVQYHDEAFTFANAP